MALPQSTAVALPSLWGSLSLMELFWLGLNLLPPTYPCNSHRKTPYRLEQHRWISNIEKKSTRKRCTVSFHFYAGKSRINTRHKLQSFLATLPTWPPELREISGVSEIQESWRKAFGSYGVTEMLTVLCSLLEHERASSVSSSISGLSWRLFSDLRGA